MPEELEHTIERLKLELSVGFDTESRPSFVKGQHYPISLLQFATHKEVYIIQLRKTGFIDCLSSFFEAAVEKVGVGLADDIRKLKELRDFTPAAMVDLCGIAKAGGHQKTSLRVLSAYYLGKRIVKSSQKTNWARNVLTEKQLRYAAIDAWACLLIRPLLEKNIAQGFPARQFFC